MCKLLNVPFICHTWQAKLAMKAIDKNGNNIADTEELYRVFLHAQSIVTGEKVPDMKPEFLGPDWREDGKLGYGKSQGIGMGMPANCLGYYAY